MSTLGQSLPDYLARVTADLPCGAAVTRVIAGIAVAATGIADVIALGALAGDLAKPLGQGAGGDLQKSLDLEAHQLLRDALRGCGVGAFASEEAGAVECLDADGPLFVALDPIDGSGGIDTNTPVGTIFSIGERAAPASLAASGEEPFAWPDGTAQLAAGFFTYGPQTTLMLTAGETVDLFTLDRRIGTFRLTQQALRMPDGAVHDYAINGSNYRHWEEPVRAFVDECLAGTSGHYGRDFNTRWHGALVAEAYRILNKGGVYLYPSDAREGYGQGRLRLIYEAYPMALLLERAGGAASTGRRRILEIEAKSLHQRVPLIFGSKEIVERLEGLHHRPSLWPAATSPLFATRGLFRS